MAQPRTLPVGDDPVARRRRLAKTVPAMLALTIAGLLATPLALPAAAVADLACGRVRLPSVRMYLFLLQYALNDSVEIVLAPVLWVMAGLGTRIDGPASIRRHERLQRWSVAVLARRADRLLGLRVEVIQGADALEPGPAIVLCRHVNLADASLPSLLYQVQRGYRVRGVIMAELLADPGFDLLYRRLGSVFVNRDSGDEARRAVAAVAGDLDARAVAVIFPEGRLFRPELRDHFLARLAERAPERHARLGALRHVLPPRPGGVLALLDAAPGADVVVIMHAGLDAVASFRQLRLAVPLHDPLRVVAWRIRRADIPEDPGARIAWLDDLWRRVDATVHALGERSSVDPRT